MAAGEDEIVKKVGEEAVEVILAAKGQGDQRLVEEVADLTYHLLVLLHSQAPAVTEEAGAQVPSRTKRATLSRLVRISPR
jgi:phosphoribosyl-ATP pyrophosphohydrolase